MRTFPSFRLLSLLLPLLLPSAESTLAAGHQDRATPEFRDVARDDDGRLWGIGGGEASLCFLDADEHWKPAVPPELQGMGAACLARRVDGTVVCLWQRGGSDYRCSEHRGSSSRVLAPFTIDDDRVGVRWRFTADAKGGLWLLRDGPGIYRLQPDGTAACLHRITPDECLPGHDSGQEPGTGWGCLSVIEDGGGRFWFWTNHADGAENVGTIRGALVYEPRDATFTQHDFLLPGSPPQRSLTALARKDDGHLWFSQWDRGLWTLDTATFQAERLPEQPKEVSLILRILHAECGAWFVVCGGDRPDDIGGSMLWRLTGGGMDAQGAAVPVRWEKRIDGIDIHQSFSGQGDRVFVTGPGGEYVGGNGKGLWFVPCDGSASRLLDWRQNFSLQNPSRLFNLHNGRWLGLDRKGQTWIGSPEALLAERAQADNPRVRTVHTEARVMPDTHGHLWSTFVHNGPSLREWDGERWTDHGFPAAVGAYPNLILLNHDGRGRIWLRGNAQKRRVVIYDPAMDQWEVFDRMEPALEAHAKDGRAAEFEEIESRGIGMPRYGPNRQITYLDEEARVSVAVFDGQGWRHWSEEEITGQPRHGYDGGSFFNAAGRPCINVDHQSWEETDPTHWKVAAYDPGFGDWQDHLKDEEFHPSPEDKIPFGPDSAARDNQGAWWLTWQHTLYKARDGWCVPVFASGEANPFTDGRRLTRAFVDVRGNAVLSASGTVIIAPFGSLPHTTLAEEPAATVERKTVRLTTGARVDGKARFRWRLDGGSWNTLDADGADGRLVFDGLPSGPHRLEARSIDAALQTDPAPTVLAFDVRVSDPQARIAKLIAQLGDADHDQRKAAVGALANDPRETLPALRAAREKAVTDDDRRWWIDAAIQHAERVEQARGRERTPVSP